MGNFFYKVRCSLERFMYGRNGTDQLNVALLVLYVILALLQTVVIMLVPYQAASAVSTLWSILLWAVAIFLLFRIFSRNLEKRRRENQWFLDWWGPLSRSWRARRARGRDRSHKYFRCRQCGIWCRVPRGKGRIEITCPRCGGKINGRS